MRHPGVSLILATGGAGVVKAAYSAGTPAIGVGPANTPALVCADADVEATAEAVVISKAFDNGLVCGAEHNLVVEASVRDRFMAALERAGAAALGPAEAARFMAAVVRPALIERFVAEMPASRVLVNSPATHGVVGLTTGLNPSLTLGCGTFGGNSTTDNVTYSNLTNIKRLAYYYVP